MNFSSFFLSLGGKAMGKRSLILIFVSLIAIAVMYLQPYKFVVVVGSSMEPTYKNGNILLAKKTNKYKVGDVVVVRNNDGIIIKRIAFMGGQKFYTRLNYDKNEIELIYGPVLQDHIMNPASHNYPVHEISIPKKQYYLLGDNWDNSEDSRFFGSIEENQILYKIVD